MIIAEITYGRNIRLKLTPPANIAVISVLYAASQLKGLEECLEGPKQVVIEPQEEVVIGEPAPNKDLKEIEEDKEINKDKENKENV